MAKRRYRRTALRPAVATRMTDPRIALRATAARWLRVRAQLRASANRLAAEEHALQRAAVRSEDPAMTELLEQLRAQRASVDVVAADVDERLNAVQGAIGMCAREYVSTLVVESHQRRWELGAEARFRSVSDAAI